MKYCPSFDFDSPRQQRVLCSLLELRYVWREDIDRIARASNGPQVILELRRRGWRIKCRRVDKIDFDGKRCNPGLYWLHPNHKSIAREVLAQVAACTSSSIPTAAKLKQLRDG